MVTFELILCNENIFIASGIESTDVMELDLLGVVEEEEIVVEGDERNKSSSSDNSKPAAVDSYFLWYSILRKNFHFFLKRVA